MNVVYLKDDATEMQMSDMPAGSIFIHISPNDKDMRHMLFNYLSYVEAHIPNGVLYTILDSKQAQVASHDMLEALMKNSEN